MLLNRSLCWAGWALQRSALEANLLLSLPVNWLPFFPLGQYFLFLTKSSGKKKLKKRGQCKEIRHITLFHLFASSLVQLNKMSLFCYKWTNRNRASTVSWTEYLINQSWKVLCRYWLTALCETCHVGMLGKYCKLYINYRWNKQIFNAQN